MNSKNQSINNWLTFDYFNCIYVVFQLNFGWLTNKGADEGGLAFPGQIREPGEAVVELHNAEEPWLPSQEGPC